MLRIDQIRLLPGDSEELLRGKCAKLLRVPAGDVTSCTVLRKAIDAREGLTFVYTAAVAVRNEAQVLRRCRSIYRQAAENYNAVLRNPLLGIPGHLMGFTEAPLD